ncbi:MAG TPA: chemotaxis protein CheW [Rhodoblastus sp.]|nr:chemotaxis protein CheW [Rhodoblastus sp.]
MTAASQAFAPTQLTGADSRRGFFTVQAAGQLFGLPVDAVQTIFRLQAITLVPLGPPVVAGLVNLRGKIVVALSLEKRLGLQSSGGATSALAVAVERRGETFALIVDSVGDAIECEEHERIASPRHIHDDRARLTAAYYRTAGGILPILDVDALFDMRADALATRLPAQPSVNGHPGANP